MQLSDSLSGLGPVAAGAACIKDQTIGTVLEIGLSMAALVELGLVCWVWVHSTGFAHAEVGIHAIGAPA